MTDEPLTLRKAADRIKAGDITSVELTRAAIAQADLLGGVLGTYVSRFDAAAMAAAEQADRRRTAGETLGPLHGIPIAIKDIISTREGPSTANSLVLDREWGAGRDAPAVTRLRAAGAVITGKTTTSEFAYGRPDPETAFAIPRNPWDPSRWSGGSSAGSGNGVAAGLFLGALGTDTGGSVRGPAASCGVTGFIATFGLVPKTGVVPLGYSLDRVGALARSAEDCAMVLSSITGYEPGDPDSHNRPPADLTASLDLDLRGLRVGVAPLHREFDDSDPAVETCLAAALSALKDAGATISEVNLPHYTEVCIATGLTMNSEALAYHGEDMRNRWHDYWSTTRSKIIQGAFVSGADYVQAQRVRNVAKRELTNLYGEVDATISPTQAFGALPYDAKGYVHDPSNKMGRLYFTVYWSGVGNPVMSVPMGFTADGMPLGFQIAGRLFDEATVARIGHAYQARTDWHRRVPPLVREAALQAG